MPFCSDCNKETDELCIMHNLCDDCDRALNNAILLKSYLTHLVDVLDEYTDEIEVFNEQFKEDTRLGVNVAILHSSIKAFPVICAIVISELDNKFKLITRKTRIPILPEPEGEM